MSDQVLLKKGAVEAMPDEEFSIIVAQESGYDATCLFRIPNNIESPVVVSHNHRDDEKEFWI